MGIEELNNYLPIFS